MAGCGESVGLLDWERRATYALAGVNGISYVQTSQDWKVTLERGFRSCGSDKEASHTCHILSWIGYLMSWLIGQELEHRRGAIRFLTPKVNIFPRRTPLRVRLYVSEHVASLAAVKISYGYRKSPAMETYYEVPRILMYGVPMSVVESEMRSFSLGAGFYKVPCPVATPALADSPLSVAGVVISIPLVGRVLQGDVHKRCFRKQSSMYFPCSRQREYDVLPFCPSPLLPSVTLCRKSPRSSSHEID